MRHQERRAAIGQLLHTLIGYVDRGSILLVVYAAFSAAVYGGLWKRVSPLELLALVLVCGVLLVVVLLAAGCAAAAGSASIHAACSQPTNDIGRAGFMGRFPRAVSKPPPPRSRPPTAGRPAASPAALSEQSCLPL
mgnify:CR=1 FL=1